MNIRTAAKLTPVEAESEGGGACVEVGVSVPVPVEGEGAEPELPSTTLTVNFWPAAQCPETPHM